MIKWQITEKHLVTSEFTTSDVAPKHYQILKKSM